MTRRRLDSVRLKSGVPSSRTTVGSSYFPEHTRSCVSVGGESCEEIASNLLAALRSTRMI